VEIKGMQMLTLDFGFGCIDFMNPIAIVAGVQPLKRSVLNKRQDNG
jgi:hypothetical protein